MTFPFASKYILLLGHYGSGKTELALALARKQRQQVTGRTVLVDLDIVNPYFRSAEQGDLLRGEGIEVLMPSFALSSVDVPSLPAQIQSVFEADYAGVVMDVGGDDTGATVLGQYHPQLSRLRDQMTVLYVVNPFRPLSGTAEEIGDLFARIEKRARLRPDFLVNNANLQEQTTAQDLMDGQALLTQASQRLGVPIGLVAGREKLRAELPPAMQALFFPFEPLMKPDWLVDEP